MQPKILTVTNRKGGTGKSTITILLASALAFEGHKVLVLDCDNQRSIVKLRQLEKGMEGASEPYMVEGLSPQFIIDYLKIHGSKYNVIFIDLPRFTSSSDNESMQIVSLCDGVLIPLLGGTIEILSANDFINGVKSLAEYKTQNNIEFCFYGFLNRRTRRSENKDTIEYMKAEGLPMFNNSLSDLKIFANPSTYESILNTEEGRTRFHKFYNEFKTKYNI